MFSNYVEEITLFIVYSCYKRLEVFQISCQTMSSRGIDMVEYNAYFTHGHNA